MFPSKINRMKSTFLCCLFACMFFLIGIEAGDYKILDIKDSPTFTWPNEMPAKKSAATYKPGKSFDNLRENSIRAYAHYWKLQGTYPVTGAKQKTLVKAVISALPKRLQVHRISDKIAIVEVPWHRAESLAEKSSIDDISHSSDIWLLENDTWFPFFGDYIPYRKAQRIDLNGDGFEDIIITGGCCDTISMNIFINKGNESVIYSQHISAIGNIDMQLLPNCSAKISVSHFQDENTKKNAKFDCSKDGFVP